MAEVDIKAKHYYESETIDGKSEIGYRGLEKSHGTPGKSNTTSLQAIFKAAPIVGYTPLAIANGANMASAHALKEWFFNNVVNGKTIDGSFGLGTFNLDYVDAPDISLTSTYEEKGATGVANPFVPNPVVDVNDPKASVAAPEAFVGKLKSKGAATLNPSVESAKNKAAQPNNPSKS